jgi:uncharacterized protein YqeY
MSTKLKLESDLKDAMRARDTVRLGTMRSLRAAIQKREIELRSSGEEIGESDIIQILQKAAKQRRESIEQFQAAGRDDLVSVEQGELAIIETYLPQQLSDTDLLAQVQKIVDEVGATSMADVGKVMGPAMSQLRGKADGKRVQAVVKQLLA